MKLCGGVPVFTAVVLRAAVQWTLILWIKFCGLSIVGRLVRFLRLRRRLPARRLSLADLLPVRLEPGYPGGGQGVFDHLGQYLIRNGCDVGPGLGGQSTVQGVADTGRQHLCFNLVFLIYGNDVFYQVDPFEADVIQAADEWTDRGGAGWAPKMAWFTEKHKV